jgi:adenylate cyclase
MPAKPPTMNRIALLLIICLSGILLHAQKLDSLFSVWQDPTRSDSVRIIAYKDYIWKGFLYSDPDSTLKLVQALHSYAQAHNYPRARALGYGLQGLAHVSLNNFKDALENYDRAIEISEELNDQKSIAANLNNIGLVYQGQGSYSRALTYFNKALILFEKIESKKGMANTTGNIGNIYFEQGNNQRALEYFKKSLSYSEEMGDKRGISINLGNTGNILINQGNYPGALESYEKSLEIKKEIGDKLGVANILNNIGRLYSEQDNLEKAMEFTKKALSIAEETGNKTIISNCLNNLGKIYQRSGKYNLAIENCKKSFVLTEAVGILQEHKTACQCLYDTYKAMDKGGDALIYMEKIRVIEDSLNFREITKKLEQMEFAKVMLQDSIAKAEEARMVQEAHIQELSKKNQTRNILIGIGAFLLLLAVGFDTRWRYVQKSKAALQVEKDRSENLLLNILPEEIARELKEKGRADARDFDMVSIIFTDFKGFTEQSAKLSAAALVSEINHCFEAFDHIMEKFGIEKIKTIGDAYMAAGGLPVSTDDSVKNTVLAALEMQRFIIHRKAQNDAEGNPAFDMRLGIHTGPVVAGIVGVKKFQYDIWGDTVNTASRMESSGEVGKVNISEATYEYIKDDSQFKFESRGKIEAKGKGEIEMFFVSNT